MKKSLLSSVQALLKGAFNAQLILKFSLLIGGLFVTTSSLGQYMTLASGFTGFPGTDGEKVVWNQTVNNEHFIHIYDGTSNSTFNLNGIAPVNPQISGDLVTWQSFDGNDYEIYYLNGGVITKLTDNTIPDVNPKVYGNNIVWQGLENGQQADIYLFDGTMVHRLTDSDKNEIGLSISAFGIVWAAPDDGGDQEIMLYRNGTVSQITNNSRLDNNPQVSESGVVWEYHDGQDNEIMFFDGVATHQITNNTVNDGAPHIDGRGIVWQSNQDIFYHDGNQTFHVGASTDGESVPKISNGNIVWVRTYFLRYYTCSGPFGGTSTCAEYANALELRKADGSRITITSNARSGFSYSSQEFIIAGNMVVWRHSQGLTAVKFNQPQTITFNPLEPRTYGDAPFQIIAMTSTGSFSLLMSSDPSVASISGTRVTIHKAGTTVITAYHPGNFFFNPAPAVEQQLVIRKAPLQATANNASMLYGDDIPPLSISYSGFVGADNITVIDQLPQAFSSTGSMVAPKELEEISPSDGIVKEAETVPVLTVEEKDPTNEPVEQLPQKLPAFPNVGDYPINVVGGLDNNYEIIRVAGVLTINKAPLTVRPQNIEREYGEANPQIVLLYDGFKGTEDQTQLTSAPSPSTDAQQFSDVGEYTITVAGGSATNYNLMPLNGTLTVTQAPLTVIADENTIEYGEPTVLTYTYSGFKGSDDASKIDTPPAIALDYDPGTQESGSQFLNVGQYPIVVSDGADNNYHFTHTPGTLIVRQAPLRIEAPHLRKSYGDPNPGFTLVYTGFKGTEDARVINVPPQVGSLAQTLSPVGTYGIFISLASDNNYIITVVGGTLIVDPAPLSVIAGDLTKVYGEEPSQEPTIRYEGFKGTEDASVLDVAPIASTAVSVDTDAGTYPIVVEGGADDNYDLQYVNGVYTVTKAPLTATAGNEEVVYGEPLPKPTLVFSGFVGDDDVTALDVPVKVDYKIPSTAFEIDKVPNAGTYGIGVGTPIDNNYEIIPVHGALTIKKARLYVDFVPVEAVYMDPLPKILLQYHGFRIVDGKVLDGVKNLERIPKIFIEGNPLDAGTYPVTISGGLDNNYDFDYFTEGYVRIRPAVLTIWIEHQATEYGNDGQIDLTFQYQGFKGLEDVSVLDAPPVAMIIEPAREKGAQFVPAGTHPIHVISGGDNNYTFDYMLSFITINKAPLVAKPLDAIKIYGDENPAFVLSYTGLKGTESAGVIDTPPSAISTAGHFSSVGNYPITLSGGTDNNYEIALGDGTLTIDPAPLTVIAENKSKMYGQQFYMSPTIRYEGFKGTDDASVLDVSPSISTTVTGTSDAGSYPIIVEGGSDLNYDLGYVNGTYTVNKVTLTATADDKTKVYGEANPEFTLTYSGFVNGEDATVIDMDPDVLFVADEFSPPGTYPINFDGGSDINYDFNIVAGTLTITEPQTPVSGKPTANCYLTSPANNALNVNYYVVLTSNFVVGAQEYTMQVSKYADFPPDETINKYGSKEIPFLLEYDTRYYVRIQTDQAPGVWSVTSVFTTGNPLTLAYITSPEDGAVSVPTNVKVTANNLYGATLYTIELNTAADFTGTSVIQNSDGRAVAFKKLEKATTYYARVTTDLTPGVWGPVTSFTTQDPNARTRDGWEGEEAPDFETDGISYSIYPNPFAEKIIVHVQTLGQAPVELSLFDLSGRMHESKSARTNSMVVLGEGVSHGVYMLQIETGKGRRFVRVVKGN